MAAKIETVQAAIVEFNHQYNNSWNNSDVILVVENEKFHVHSSILTIASPVFSAMLSTHFKEGEERIINLPGKDKSAVLGMLNIIYPIDYIVTDYSSCKELLELAREYDIKRITQLVDNFVAHEVECSVNVFSLAEKYTLEKTRKKHIDYYIKAIDDTKSTIFNGDWSNVSDKTKLEILYGKIQSLDIRHASNFCKACRSFSFCDHMTNFLRFKDVLTLHNTVQIFKEKK